MAISIPTAGGAYQLELEAGHSAVLIGANGTGKTRLGVWIEQSLQGAREMHRIAAHRALVMNTRLDLTDFERAERMLRFGYAEGTVDHRQGHRWGNRPATQLLSDFDHLIRALYADEYKVSVDHRRAHLQNPAKPVPATKLDRVKVMWEAVLPHRELVVGAGDIKAQPRGSNVTYDAGELSDGERQVFYLIGQCMMARPGCLLLIDEPELHVNKAIQSKLWDTIESERADCSFLYFTHDLEFAASRRGATKLVLRSFTSPGIWDVEEVPEDVDLPEDVVAKILGSRQPILFVEGTVGSLDVAVYGVCTLTGRLCRSGAASM